MTGYKVVRSFYHKKTKVRPDGMYLVGDNIKEINEAFHEQLEKQGLIRWVERPEIIHKPKKRVRNSKK